MSLLSTRSTSASSSAASSASRLFSGTQSAGSLNTVAPDPEAPSTTPSISDCAPALSGTHSRPSRVTTCALSAKFLLARNRATSESFARSVRSVSLRSSRIARSDSDASSATFPPGITRHRRISGAIASGIEASGAARSRSGARIRASSSSASSPGRRSGSVAPSIESHTAAHAAHVVAMSAREEPLRTRPRLAPATNARISRVPSKTSRRNPPARRRRTAAVVSARRRAECSGEAPRGSAGAHARAPRVVAVNARTCAESSGHWSKSRASASSASALGSSREGAREGDASSPSSASSTTTPACSSREAAAVREKGRRGGGGAGRRDAPETRRAPGRGRASAGAVVAIAPTARELTTWRRRERLSDKVDYQKSRPAGGRR